MMIGKSEGRFQQLITMFLSIFQITRWRDLLKPKRFILLALIFVTLCFSIWGASVLFALKHGVDTLPVAVIIEGLSEEELVKLKLHYISLQGKVRNITNTREENTWSVNGGYLRAIQIAFPEKYADTITSVRIVFGEYFRPTKPFIQALKNEGLPENIYNAFLPLKHRKFFTQYDFLKAVEREIGRKNTDTYQERILKHVVLDNREFVYPGNALMEQWEKTEPFQAEGLQFITLQSPGNLTVNKLMIPEFKKIINLRGAMGKILGNNLLISIVLSLIIMVILHVVSLCMSTEQKHYAYLRNLKRIAPWLCAALIVSLCTANFIFIAAVFRRGFFSGDAGRVMLLMEGSVLNDTLSAVFAIIPRLVFWTSPDVITYRVVRLVVGVGLGGFVYFAFWRWLKTVPEQARLRPLELAAGVGLVLVGSTLYPMLFVIWELDHHDLLQWAARLITGFFLLSLTTKNSKTFYLIGFGVGFVAGWAFFLKFPSAFFLSGVFVLGYWLASSPKLSRFIPLVLCLLAGVVLAVMVFFGFVQSPAQWFETVEIGLRWIDSAPDRTSLSKYLIEAKDLVKTVIIAYSPFLLLGFGVLYYPGRRKVRTLQIAPAQVVTGIIAMAPIWILLYYILIMESGSIWKEYLLAWLTVRPVAWVITTLSGKIGMDYLQFSHFMQSSYFMLALLLLAIAMVAGAALRGSRLSWKKATQRMSQTKVFVVLGVLCVMPVTVAIGSYYSLLWYMREGIWAWALALVALAAWTKSRMNAGLRWWVFFLLPCFLMITQQYYMVRFLYGGPGNIVNYQYTLDGLPKGQGILLTNEEADYYKTAYRILTGKSDYKPGDNILGFYQVPNLIYLLGGKMPVYPTLPPKSYNVELMEYLSDQELASAFIIITKHPIEPGVLQAMRARGALFPEAYEKIGELVEYRSHNPVSIYAPKNRLR